MGSQFWLFTLLLILYISVSAHHPRQDGGWIFDPVTLAYAEWTPDDGKWRRSSGSERGESHQRNSGDIEM